MPRPVAYVGAKKRIEYAVDRSGQSPGLEFYAMLDDRNKAKFNAFFQRMGEHGEIKNREQFKKIEGTDFWEFKWFQIRMVCRFRPGGVVLISHGFEKKKDRIPDAEIQRAQRIFTEDNERESRQGAV